MYITCGEGTRCEGGAGDTARWLAPPGGNTPPPIKGDTPRPPWAAALKCWPGSGLVRGGRRPAGPPVAASGRPPMKGLEGGGGGRPLVFSFSTERMSSRCLTWKEQFKIDGIKKIWSSKPKSAFRIRDISVLIRMRIQILGSVP
jgi:hypothetical protein